MQVAKYNGQLPPCKPGTAGLFRLQLGGLYGSVVFAPGACFELAWYANSGPHPRSQPMRYTAPVPGHQPVSWRIRQFCPPAAGANPVRSPATDLDPQPPEQVHSSTCRPRPPPPASQSERCTCAHLPVDPPPLLGLLRSFRTLNNRHKRSLGSSLLRIPITPCFELAGPWCILEVSDSGVCSQHHPESVWRHWWSWAQSNGCAGLLTPAFPMSLMAPLTILENNMVTELKVNRRSKERRVRVDQRRQQDEHFTGEEKRTVDRRKVERRRQIDPTTCERDYKPDEIEFMQAMDDYKRRSGRQFPTWSEVLEVLRDLGYRKVAAPSRTYE